MSGNDFLNCSSFSHCPLLHLGSYLASFSFKRCSRFLPIGFLMLEVCEPGFDRIPPSCWILLCSATSRAVLPRLTSVVVAFAPCANFPEASCCARRLGISPDCPT